MKGEGYREERWGTQGIHDRRRDTGVHAPSAEDLHAGRSPQSCRAMGEVIHRVQDLCRACWEAPFRLARERHTGTA